MWGWMKTHICAVFCFILLFWFLSAIISVISCESTGNLHILSDYNGQNIFETDSAEGLACVVFVGIFHSLHRCTCVVLCPECLVCMLMPPTCFFTTILHHLHQRRDMGEDKVKSKLKLIGLNSPLIFFLDLAPWSKGNNPKCTQMHPQTAT